MRALTGTLFAMVADTIEYGQWKTGTRVEGMLYSSTTFGAKIGGGVGGAVALAIIGAAGYNGLCDSVQPETAITAIKNLYLAAPISVHAGHSGILLFFISWISFIPQ